MAKSTKYNIINQREIKKYLDSFAEGDKTLAEYLNIALAKALAKERNSLEEVTELPKDAPGWLRNKWGTDQTFYQFKPAPNLRTDIRHIRDWIRGAINTKADWTEATDDKGRPTKLLKIGTLKDAIIQADKYVRQNIERNKDLVEADEDTELYKKLNDEFSIVRILTRNGLNREGGVMGHCLGEGSYGDAMEKGEKLYLSLRDQYNKPHVTFEIDTKTNTLLECKGKGNARPIDKYLPHVKEFIKENNFELEEEALYTGLLQQDGQYYDFPELPPNFIIKDSIQVDAATFYRIPEDTIMEDDVVIVGKITDIPEKPRDITKIKGKIRYDVGFTGTIEQFQKVQDFLELYNSDAIPTDILLENSAADSLYIQTNSRDFQVEIRNCNIDEFVIIAKRAFVRMNIVDSKISLFENECQMDLVNLKDTTIKKIPNEITCSSFTLNNSYIKKWDGDLYTKDMRLKNVNSFTFPKFLEAGKLHIQNSPLFITPEPENIDCRVYIVERGQEKKNADNQDDANDAIAEFYPEISKQQPMRTDDPYYGLMTDEEVAREQEREQEDEDDDFDDLGGYDDEYPNDDDWNLNYPSNDPY